MKATHDSTPVSCYGTSMDTSPSAVPWANLAAFFRQHTHDVRNDINGIDLEMELLQELQSDPEALESMNHIRQQLRGMEQRLRSLSVLFHELSPEASPIAASVLLQIWREKHAVLPQAGEVAWVNHLDGETVNVDEEMMGRVFMELLDNAAAFSAGALVTVTGKLEDGMAVFEVSEPKTAAVDPAAWMQPFRSTRHGHHGLGLWTARRMAEANGASFEQRFDDKAGCLVTRVALPTCA